MSEIVKPYVIRALNDVLKAEQHERIVLKEHEKTRSNLKAARKEVEETKDTLKETLKGKHQLNISLENGMLYQITTEKERVFVKEITIDIEEK